MKTSNVGSIEPVQAPLTASQLAAPATTSTAPSSLLSRLPLSPALLATLLLLLVVAGSAYFFQQQAEEALNARQLTYQIQIEISSLKADVMELSRGLRGYAISGKDDWLDPYRDARKDAVQRLRQLKLLTAHNPVMQRHLDVFDDRLEVYLTYADKTLTTAAEQGFEAARAHIASGVGRAEVQKMESVVDDMNAEEARLLQLRDALADHNSALASGVTILGNLLALVVIAWAGFSLNKTVTELRLAALKQAAQDWSKSGLARINQRLQGGRDPSVAAQALLSELADHLGAQHAVFYASEQALSERESGRTAGNGSRLRLLASYAFRERKHLAASFELGEGLVGQCALERQRILLQQAPPDYIRILSGLGESAPLDVVVLPITHQQRLHGVLELATLQRLSAHQLDFLDQLAAQLGILFNAMDASHQVDLALQRSQELTQELQTGEEELKASNEELQEQSRLLEESQQELKNQQEELQSTNEELEEKSNQLEQERATIISNNLELERSQVELEERAEQLAVTGKYKSEFLANMSHELRTPLNSLLLLSHMLSDNKEGNLTPKQIEYVRTIHEGGNDLLNLINEILDLSKIESGRLEIQTEAVPLVELVEFVERQFKAVAEQKKLGFDISLAQGLPDTINTDEQRLEQVLRNLLSNALKFTEKGSVKLSLARPAASTRFEHEALRQAGSAVLAFAVQDSGIGIDSKLQSTIWEAFQQADSGVARKYGGTGLGLTISREIARLLGGEIHLQSQPGQGSTFTLYLPEQYAAAAEQRPSRPSSRLAVPAAPARSLPAAPLASSPDLVSVAAEVQDDRVAIDPANKTKRVALIIEDDVRFAAILRDLARQNGFQALVAGRGDEGLHLARQFTPDCIFLDLGLPDMDGSEVLRTALSEPALRRIPIEVISGHERGRQLIEQGAFAFLQKPVSPDALEESFKRLKVYLEQGPKRVLLVEDEPYARAALAKLVASGDVQVSAARDGKEALALLAQEKFDALILDLRLPDMDGRDLLAQAHKDLGITDLPVIVYTAKELNAKEERALLQHAHAIVIKSEAAPQRLLQELGLFLHGVKQRLPAEKREVLRQIRDPQANPLLQRKVLVVDDDMRNLFSLTAFLEDQGMLVETAENGRAALECLAAQPDIELVLMDIMMPEMDGLEATRRIRAEARWKALPVIALTAKAMKGDREKCLQAGASDYLAKPVDVDKLINLMRVWLYR